jgi:hypothetical protein
VLLNIGEVGDDYRILVGIGATPMSRHRRRWRAHLPENLPRRTNRVVIVATRRNGTDRTYHAAAEVAPQG